MKVNEDGSIREPGTAWPTTGGSLVVLQEHGFGLNTANPVVRDTGFRCEGCNAAERHWLDDRTAKKKAADHAKNCTAIQIK